MDGRQDFNDLSGQQRAHLVHDLGAQLEHERLRVSLWLLQKVRDSADAKAAADWAAAFASLQAPGAQGATRGPGTQLADGGSRSA